MRERTESLPCRHRCWRHIEDDANATRADMPSTGGSSGLCGGARRARAMRELTLSSRGLALTRLPLAGSDRGVPVPPDDRAVRGRAQPVGHIRRATDLDFRGPAHSFGALVVPASGVTDRPAAPAMSSRGVSRPGPNSVPEAAGMGGGRLADDGTAHEQGRAGGAGVRPPLGLGWRRGSTADAVEHPEMRSRRSEARSPPGGARSPAQNRRARCPKPSPLATPGRIRSMSANRRPESDQHNHRVPSPAGTRRPMVGGVGARSEASSPAG